MNKSIINSLPNYQLSRALLAFSQLATLNLGNIRDLFNESRLNNGSTIFDKISVFHIFGYDNLGILEILISVLLILVILGILPHLTSILHWWVSFSFLQSAVIVEGGDQVVAILTFLLIPIIFICNNNSYLSISRKVELTSFKLIFLKSIYFLISIQISYIYFEAGYAKLAVAEWTDGTAIYYWFFHNTFGSHIITELPIFILLIKSSYFTCIITWSVILFEILFSTLVLLEREERRQFFIYGFLFHFLIYIFIGLGSFSVAMIAAVILYTLPFENHIKFLRDESI